MKKNFRPGNSLPPLIHNLIKEAGFESMEPGEETWTVPWSVTVNGEGRVFLRKPAISRDSKAGGTASLKIVADFEGVYLDATALSREDLAELRFKEGDLSEGIVGGSEDDFVSVLGVLYPLIEKHPGMEPGEVETYNREQEELRRQFAERFESIYHRPYTFAEDEYPGYRQLPGLEYPK